MKIISTHHTKIANTVIVLHFPIQGVFTILQLNKRSKVKKHLPPCLEDVDAL